MHLHYSAGGIRWVDNSALPLLDAHNAVIGYRGVARDVTQKRLQQERIARLSRIQAVLSGINATILRIRDRRELFREACRIAVQQGGFRVAWIGLVEPGAVKATPLVWEGFEQGFLAESGQHLVGMESDPTAVGRALAQKKMVVVNDIASDPTEDLKREALSRSFRSRWPCR